MNIPVALVFMVMGVTLEFLWWLLPPRPLYRRGGLFLIGTGIGFLIPVHIYIDSLVIGIVLVVLDVVYFRKGRKKTL